MSDRTPFYKRTLDSFADHIITRARPRDDGSWHAILDCGFRSQVSDPDFSPYGYGKSHEEASARSAAAIRADARGIGKFAPHSLLVPGYDLHWRLMRHWEMKERFEVVGLDPNEMYYLSVSASNDGENGWQLSGEYLDVVKEKRLLEFVVRLHMAEVFTEIETGNGDALSAAEQVVVRVKEELSDVGWRSRPTDGTWKMLDSRIDTHMNEKLKLPGLSI